MEPISNLDGFTGERWEAYSQLLFLRARYHEPGTGRFVTEDRTPGYAQVPQSLHIYVYAWNRPTQLTDPSGRQVPPGQCKPGEICAGGTTGPYVFSMPMPTGPYLVERPMRRGKSYLFPGDPFYQLARQKLLVEYCPMPLWQVLHYYLPEHLYIRSELYPVPIPEAEMPLSR